MSTQISTALSPAALEQLSTPRDIPWSMPKLVLRTVIGAAFALLFFWAAWKLIVIDKADPDKIGYWFALVAGLVFGGLSFLPTLSGWRGRSAGHPAVSISKAGLTFAGQPLIAWPLIVENNWRTVYAVGYLPITAEIRVRGVDGGSISVLGKTNLVSFRGKGYHSFNSTCFGCSSKKYLEYCELYRAAGAQNEAGA
jgi:hypothetical protein